MPSLRRLQQYAIAISIASIIWNGLEGGLSIGFGAESSSRSLVFFGIQSAIEVISAVIVVWRFIHVAKPGEEQGLCLSPSELRFEKYSTIAIGGLLVALALATAATAAAGLALHFSPDASIPALAISASALLIMVLIWLPKRHLAITLNSAALQGEAACSLACIQITLVLFVGALTFRLRQAAWWLDGATALVLALLFAAEGAKMLRWACSSAFDGGCCDHRGLAGPRRDIEMPAQYRDLCACCDEKEVCKHADACRCDEDLQGCGAATQHCCALRDDGKCCTYEIRTGPRPIALSMGDCADASCAPPPAVTTSACKEGCCTSPAADCSAVSSVNGPEQCVDECCVPESGVDKRAPTPTVQDKCTEGCCG